MSATFRGILALPLLLAALPTGAQQRGNGSFDAYGYAAYDSSAAQCSYSYIDASAGSALTLTAAGAAAAADDGGAAVHLAAPFQLYGTDATALVASSNGYLASAADLSVEDGGDFSADCPLPAIADNAAASQARIYVYHGDLDGAPNGGAMFSQYYASCPRASDSGIAEACSVVQWHNWALRGQSGTLEVEAVLYHTTFEIALQYGSLDAGAGSGVTIGTQSHNATSGNAYGCGGSRTLAPHTAACLFDPRYPPGSLGLPDEIFRNGFDS